MRRVLFVAYYFPPIAGIGSIRAAGFARHLPEFGWEPVVLAPRDTPHPSDPDLRFPEDKVVRSRSIELSRLGRATERQTRPQNAPAHTSAMDRLLGSVRSAGRRAVFPDAQVGWYPGSVAAGLRAMRRNEFDIVYSSSFPITTHLVGATLSWRSGLPWVAEFRDPWSDALPAGVLRQLAKSLEVAIAKRADRVVMPTPTWARHFGERWGTDISAVPNGHDGMRDTVDSGPSTVLTHLGSFYPGRQDLTPLWDALRRIAQAGDADPPRVRFIGELHPEARSDAARYQVDHLVEATGLVPHSQATRLLESSSMLILSGERGSDPLARGWIPAKLFEYIGTDLPILYLGDPQSDAGRILTEQPGSYVVAPGQPEAIEGALRAAAAGSRYDRKVMHLSRRARAQQLADVFDEAVSAREAPSVD